MAKFLLLIFITIPLALSQEAAFDSAKELTDQEEYNSTIYIHQGMADKKAAEMCNEGVEGMKDICRNRNRAFQGGTMGTIEAMLPAVTMAYTMIMSAGGGGFKAAVKNDDGQRMFEGPKVVDGNVVEGETESIAENQLGEAGRERDSYSQETKNKKDYCSMIPMAGQAINIVQAQTANQQNQQAYQQTKPEARQAATFYTLAKTHKDQAKASKLQMGVWGATAGCYAAYLAFAGVSGDWKVYAKLAGATLITAFYKKKIDAHKKRARILEEMASELPQAGECNPFTHTSCFCNESTSFSSDPGNYNKFCVPEAMVARNQTNDAVTCVTDQGQPDPACSCTARGTCINRVLKGGIMDFGIPPTMLKDPMAGIKPISDGFGTGNLDSVTDRNLARANRALSNFKPSGPINLNDDQKKKAKTLSSFGIPPAVAATMVKRAGSNSGGGKLPASFLAGVTGDEGLAGGDQKLAAVNRNIGKMQAGGEIRKSRSNRSSKSPFSGFGKKKSRANGGVQIENDLIRRATAEAEITQDSDVNIFRIINNRYQRSGWRQFPQAFNLESSEVK